MAQELTAGDALSVAVPDTRSPGRDRWGRFLPGNTAAVSHGLQSRRTPPGLEQLDREVEAFLGAAMVDEGERDIPARRKALLVYRARLHRRILQLDAALEQRGILDKRQKLRATWLSILVSLIEKCRQIDVTLGLERRQRDLDTLTIDEHAIVERYREQRRQQHEQPETDPVDAGSEDR
jgi:hypothetical protein